MSEFPTRSFPAITRSDMVEVDRVMIEDLGISLLQMMENAGRNLADLAIERFSPTSVAVYSGPGGNGGGGMAAARHLHNRGVAVAVHLVRPDLGEVPAKQRSTLDRMGVPVGEVGDAVPSVDLVIDAIIGYSLLGDPRADAARAIEMINESRVPVLSLDTPSGLDVTTGRVGQPCVSATATLTLAMPKTGLGIGRRQVGELYVADISVPSDVYRAFAVRPESWFQDGPIVRSA
ncbi:MAG: NAD(P)H-hydrate epimerase [Acidimicrobiia bacterium]|nr:NAD(P)H-hydrate epimerase [Acidimicrobiia bacterium]